MADNDRELLMAAARAFWAGEIDDVCSIEWSDADGGVLYTHADNQDHNGHDRQFRWNPLLENYDAFELQVKLNMTVSIDAGHNWSGASVLGAGPGDGSHGSAPHNGDPLAATRRAITVAAAAIGKEMP